jgi:hypothetical protein
MCERNSSISVTPPRQNLRIMGIEEVEELQARGISDIFNKIVDNFTNQEKGMPTQFASRTPNRHNQNRTSFKE